MNVCINLFGSRRPVVLALAALLLGTLGPLRAQDASAGAGQRRIAVAELAPLELPAGREASGSVALATGPAPAPADGRVVRLMEMVMYVPAPQLEERYGTDIRPLGDYINALKARLVAVLTAAEPVPAQGLFVAVGLKTNRRSKVWCEAVEGTIPATLLKTLERELGEVEPVALKAGTAGFGLKFALSDKPPAAFPSAPERWTEAAKSTPSKTIIPPDDLFRILWPD